MMAGTFAELGRFEEALRSYNMTIKLDPMLSKAWLEKSSALKALGQREEASDTLVKAIVLYDDTLKSNPDDTSALIGKGAALDSKGNYNESIQYFDHAS
jgi:tetratricopeptide (TPR) repeat protein